MLYLLTPHQQMRWTNLPRSAVQALVEDGVDLAQLQWDPSEADDQDLVLAIGLRRGIKCSTGIAVLGEDLVLVRHPRQIAESHQGSAEAHAAIAASENALSQLIPGWAEHTTEVNAGVDASHTRALNEAQAKAERVLAEEEKADLVEHWTSLGGSRSTL